MWPAGPTSYACVDLNEVVEAGRDWTSSVVVHSMCLCTSRYYYLRTRSIQLRNELTLIVDVSKLGKEDFTYYRAIE